MSETSAPDPTLLAKLAAGDPDACLQVIDRLEHEPPAWMLHQGAKLTSLDAVAPDGQRIADLAANALIRVLKLATSFAPKPGGQYSPAELSEIRSLVRHSVPQ